jgi:hypothetical protein
MSDPIIFPDNPTVNQRFTAQNGVVYTWTGQYWAVGYYDSNTQQLSTLGDIIKQVRVLLQDVDRGSGQFRYSTDSIVLDVNQCMIDMFRQRPDLFLYNDFVIPTFDVADDSVVIGIDEQYISAIVYYVVGMVQLRDDEGTQDQRSAIFLGRFAQIMGNAL